MSKLKNRKYITLIGILVLVIGILGLFVLGRTDKYKGLVKVKNVVSDTTVLSAAISNTIEQPNTSRGSDEIKYEISYTLDRITGVDKRDVVIKASLSDAEGKYARFKKINGTNITSTVKNDGKEIEVEVRDVPLGIENRITLKLVITNAPNGFKVRPDITIKEKTSDEETPVTTSEIEVSTESITGLVKDENGTLLNNIELSLNKNGEIKRTYTDEDGRYIFSDIENGRYTVEVEEEIYELVGNNVIENSGTLNLVVKEVTPYEIEAHKYITNLDLVINGKSESYTYDDLETVVQAVKNAKTVSGQITYKISIKNIGEKTGKLSMLKDIVDKGLSFDSNKNKGWKEKDGNLYYEPIADVSINKGEKRDIGLVLDINSTKEIKTYINEITVNGETYEKVVYILNGVKYREENVILGEKIEELIIQDESFDGWYTDKNYTNKYNFNNEVTKDLILYGRTEVKKYNVEFYDKDPDSGVETPWDTQEVTEGDKAVEPEEPTKTGYTFECWMDEHDNIWNFNNPVERNLKLVSCYTLNQYSIVYKGLTDAEKTALNNPTTYTIRDTVTINNANDRYDEDELLSERFIGWTGSNGDTPSTNISFSHETGDKEYTANFEHVDPDEYVITYVLNGGELEEGKTNPSSYTKKTPTFTLNNPSKEHYRFIGWTGSNGDTPQTTVTLEKGQNEGDKEYVANYEIITHNVSFKDKDPENPVISTVTDFGDPVTVNDGEKVTPPGSNPTHTGYTCDRWSTKLDGDYNDDAYDFNTTVTSDLVLYTLCKKNSYTVTFMDGENQFARQTVLYKDKATIPSPDPTKAHNIFLGWTLNNSLYNFNTEVTQDITLYSSYEYVEEASVSHTPTEWTNQNVIVTITNKGTEGKDYTGYTYKYRVNNGQYRTYNGPFEIEENCDIYVIATKNNVDSIEVKHEITNIDKIKPVIETLEKTSTDLTSATISFSGYDNESGIKEFRLYKDDTYEGTISYETGFSEKNDEYTFNDLISGEMYTIKLLAVDVAGNISESLELEITTDSKIVCQIIGRNNSLYNNSSLNEPFSTLRAAITSCGQNQCTIQMLEDVIETNEVLDGQDITLDLNSKTVSGSGDYTIDVSGKFRLIDNGDPSGMLQNKRDTAVLIENGGIFTLGVDELVNPTVSTTVPYILGTVYGVRSIDNGTFNFYDGAIRAETAISGDVDDAPRMYTASIVSYDGETGPYQIGTLKILDDAEARIKTKYYTKVANAVADVKEGYYENVMTSANFDDNLKKSENYQYGFIKNDQGILVNENTERSTSASSEISISTIDEETDKELIINTSYLTDEDTSDSAYIYITEYLPNADSTSSNNNYVKSNSIKINSGEDKQIFSLVKGRIYTIQLYFYIGSTTPENSKLYITDIYLKNIQEDLDDTSIDKENITTYIKQYGFDYDETTQTYTSNNNYISDSTAFSYLVVDLTAETQDKMLSLKATLDAIGYYDRANIFVKTNNQLETSYQTNENTLAALSGNNYSERNFIGPYSYFKKLDAGRKYYIQFYYFKSSSDRTREQYEEAGCNDEFKIYNIKVTNYTGTMTNTTNFYNGSGLDLFHYNTEETYNYERWGTKGYSNTSNSEAFTVDGYIPFDMTNEKVEKTINMNINYGSFSSSDCVYAIITDSPESPTSSSGAFFIYDFSSGYKSNKGVLQTGKVNYLHIMFNKNSESAYVYLSSMTISDGYEFNISPDNIITPGQYGFNNSGSIYPNNTGSSDVGTTAHSFLVVDMTNNNYDNYLSMNASGNGDFAVVVNEDSNEPTSRNNAQFTNTNNQYFSGDILINLIPNKVNYVHFLSTNYNGLSFSIYNIKKYSGKSVDLGSELKRSPNVPKGFTNNRNNNSWSAQSLGVQELADSYIEVDLTGSSHDKIVGMNLDLSSSSNYKYIYLSNSKKALSYNSIINDKSKALIVYSSSVEGNSYYIGGTSYASGNHNYYIPLTKGNKYYIHFGSHSTNSTTYDFMKIYNVIINDSETVDFRTGQTGYYNTTQEETIPSGDYINNDGSSDNSFRFIGKDSKNYISFNDELWRIVGIFDTENEQGETDKRLKIVRNETIGNYSWDSSAPSNSNSEKTNEGYGINEWSQSDLMKLLNPGYSDNTDETFEFVRTKTQVTKYAHTPNISDAGVQNGNYANNLSKNTIIKIDGATQLNIEVWFSTESDRYDWLAIYPDGVTPSNSNYSSATISGGKLGGGTSSTKPLDSDTTYHRTFTVAGDTAQFYFRSDSSQNYYGYYAIITAEGYSDDSGIYSSLGSNVVNNSLYWNSTSGNCFTSTGNVSSSCDFSSIGLKENSKKFIDKVKWSTGAFNSNYNSSTVWDLYSSERSNATGKDNLSVSDDNYPLDDVSRTTSWYGKVGLLYPSDYILASGDSSSYSRDVCLSSNMTANLGSCVSSNNWLYTNSNPFYSITPTNGGYNNSVSTMPYYVMSLVGTPFNSNPLKTSTSFGVRPTVYLSTKTIISGGDGTYNNPYTITLGDSKNTIENYGFGDSYIEDEGVNITLEENSLDSDKVKKEPVYSFEYNEETGEYTNTNSSIPKTTASSYIEIDLSGEPDDKELKLDYVLNAGNANAYIFLIEDTFIDVPYSNLYGEGENSGYKYISLTSNGSSSKIYSLTHGKKYYLQFIYIEKGGYTGSFTVKPEILSDTEHLSDFTSYIGRQPVLNEEPETIQILKNINLTNTLDISALKNVVLDLNSYTLTNTTSNYVINNHGELKIIDTGYDRQVSEANALYDLEKEVYQSQLSSYRTKLHDEKTTKETEYESYTANSYKTDGLIVNLNSKIYGDVDEKWMDLSGNGNDVTIRNTNIDTETRAYKSGITVNDINTEEFTYEFTFDNANNYCSLNFGGISSYVSGDSTWSYPSYVYCENGTIKLVTNNNGNHLSKTLTPISTEKNSFAISYNNGIVKTYLNGEMVDATYLKFDSFGNEVSLNSNSLYSFRVYNRELSEEEINYNYNVDNALFNINSLSAEGLYSYEFGDNDIIYSRVYSTGTFADKLPSGNIRSFCTIGNSNNYVYSNSQGIGPGDTLFKSIKKYPFYTNNSKITLDMVTFGLPVMETNLYVGLVKELPITTYGSSIVDTSMFETYQKVDILKVSSNEINVSLTPNNFGDYYLVILLDGNFTTTTRNPSIMLRSVNFSVSEPVKREVTRSGTVESSSYTVIYNDKGAYLDIDEGIINVPNNCYGVHNKGTMTMGENGTINGVNLESKSIYNDSTGDILDGEGHVVRIYTDSDVDSGFSGYHVDSIIDNYNSSDITLKNITITEHSSMSGVEYGYGIKNFTKNKMTVSDDRNSSECTINYIYNPETEGELVLDGVNVCENVDSNSIIKVNNSTISNVYSKNNSIINNSSIGYLSNDTDSMITDSTINSLINTGTSTIKGNSTIGNISSGTVILGENDENVSNTYPKVESTETAISGSTLKMYDGSITGKVDEVFKGYVEELAEDYNLVSTINNDLETITLGKEYVARIGQDKYYSLTDAVDAAPEGVDTSIEILKDIHNIREVIIPDTKNIVIDYNGHKVQGNIKKLFTNNGTLKLIDSSNDKKSSLQYANFITNNGSLEYDGIINKYVGYETGVINDGIMNIKSGEINSDLADSWSSITYNIISNNNNLTISGGSFTGDYLIGNKESGTMNVTGGSYDNSGTIFSNSGNITIQGGNYSNNPSLLGNSNVAIIKNLNNVELGSLVYTGENANTTIENSSINQTAENNAFATCTSGSSLTISDSVFNIIRSISLDNGCNTKVNDSTISHTKNNNYSNVFNLSNSASSATPTKLELTNAEVTINTSTPTILIQDYSDLQFNSGLVKSSSGFAIKNTGTGTLTFGAKDGQSSKETLVVQGSTGGLNNTNENAIINFYDGSFKGLANNSLKGVVSDIEDGFDIITEAVDSEREIKYLSGNPIVRNINKDNKEYSGLQDAIDEANQGDTLEFLRDLTTLSISSTIEIPQTKELIIDTKGHNIIDNITSSAFIKNHGSLMIINSENDSIITNNISQPVFDNYGSISIVGFKLNITSNGKVISNEYGGTAEIRDSSITNSVAHTIIENRGLLNLNDTNITATTYDYNNDYLLSTIHNNSNNDLDGANITPGTINITNGQITTNYNIIHNEGIMNLYDNKDPLIPDSGLHLSERYYTHGFIKNDGTMNIYGGTIDASLENNEEMTIFDGDIRYTITNSKVLKVLGGTTDNINGNYNSVTTIGEKDGIIDINSPCIKHIDSSGTLNFYDGYATDETVKIESFVTNVETNSRFTIDNDKQYLIVDKMIKNLRTNEEYYSFAEAYGDINENDTLQFISSSEGGSVLHEPLTIDKSFKLDLNGKDIYLSKNNIFTITDGTLELINSSNSQASINHNSSAYGSSNSKEQVITFRVNENGTLKINGDINVLNAKIINMNSNSNVVVDNGTITGEITNNEGTITINGGTINAGASGGIHSYRGLIKITGGTFNNSSVQNYAGIELGPNSEVIIDNITFNGKRFIDGSDNGSTYITINNGTFNLNGGNLIAKIDGGYTNIKGGIFNGEGSIIYSSNDYSSTTIKNISSSISIGTLSGTVKIDDTNVNITKYNSSPVLTVLSNGKVTISENVSLITSDSHTPSYGINNGGIVTLGKKDGNVNTLGPVIKGYSYGIYSSSNGSLKFYDGIISGKTYAIYGQVSEVETNYTVKTEKDEDDYNNATLKILGDNEKVIVVNNINYDTLQSAVNSVEDNKETDMVLYTDYTLEDNITVPANKIINLYLNGFTINYGSYNILGEGTMNIVSGAPTGAGGAIYRFLASLTGKQVNPRDIIIYQMEDGTELSADVTYKLYRLIDSTYKLVNVNEIEVGIYEIDNDSSNINTTNGKVRINQIGEGTYKLVGSDGKELEFEIGENSVSNNIIVDRFSAKANVTASAIATLILQLQTGILRTPYILIILVLTILILGGYILIQKNKKRL